MPNNIKYPLQDSKKGFFFELNNTNDENIKSKLVFFLKTKKGSWRNNPNFGIDINQYLFEKLDDITKNLIRNEIVNSIEDSFETIKIESFEFVSSNVSTFVGFNVYFYKKDEFIKNIDKVEVNFR